MTIDVATYYKRNYDYGYKRVFKQYTFLQRLWRRAWVGTAYRWKAGTEQTDFTCDYQQTISFFWDEHDVVIDIDEYYNDLMNYENKKYRFNETKECFEFLAQFLAFVKSAEKTVLLNRW